MEKKYLVYRLRNSLFYRPLHLIRFLILVIGNEGNLNQVTNKVGLKLNQPNALRKVLEPLKPNYKHHEIQYYLVSEERYKDVYHYNQAAGTYPILDQYSCLEKLTEQQFEEAFLEPPIKVNGIDDLIRYKNHYDIVNVNGDLEAIKARWYYGKKWKTEL